VVDDGWESVEVEEMGAVVAPATPTIALNSTSASSSSSQFGHLVSPPLHQLHPQLASNSILNNVAAPSKSSNGVGPQLSYLQIAGSLMTSSANSSSRPAVYSSNQATSSTPLVHPSSSSSSPFAFVPKPVGKDGHDSFKDAFEQARDKLHLFERRFGGDDGRETTTTATAAAAQDATATPTKGEGKRKRSEGGSSDSEKKRTEKKSKKGDEGGADEQKKKKKKKDKKSSGKSKPKKEDGSASLALDEKPEGGFTFMQGAYFILKREHRFMTAKEIVAIGVAEGTRSLLVPSRSLTTATHVRSLTLTHFLFLSLSPPSWWPPSANRSVCVVEGKDARSHRGRWHLRGPQEAHLPILSRVQGYTSSPSSSSSSSSLNNSHTITFFFLVADHWLQWASEGSG
jgi:hypothetical protein